VVFDPPRADKVDIRRLAVLLQGLSQGLLFKMAIFGE
jgi:hypothetical protein